jgi:hypothetical protein
MAYKFSLGKYKHSGSLVSADSLTVSAGDVSLPSGTINTAELADLNVTTAKLADANVTNAKLQHSGSTLGSTAVVLGQTVASLAGLTSVSALSLTGALAVADIVGFSGSVQDKMNSYLSGAKGIDYASGAIAINFSEFSTTDVVEGDKLFYTDARARAAISADGQGVEYNSGSGQISLELSGTSLAKSADGLSLNASISTAAASSNGALSVNNATGQFTFTPVADSWVRGLVTGGDGLVYDNATGDFDVVPAGAMAIKADKVAISASIAGNGLAAQVDGDGAVTGLEVQVTGALNIVSDKLVVRQSLVGIGLNKLSSSSEGLTQISVAYGSTAGTAVEGSTVLSANAGAGMTGNFSGALGAAPSFTFDVVSANGGIVVNSDNIQLKLSSSNALIIDGNGLDLKPSISGDRTFANNVTISGDLTVNGTTTYVNTNDLQIKDSRILIASGTSAFSASHGFDFGSYASLLTALVDIDGVAGTEQVLSSSLPLVAPQVKADTFYGSLVGSAIEGIQSTAVAATAAQSIVLCDAASAGFTLTLPAASGWSGKSIKVKKADGTENAVEIDAAGSEMIDGVASIVLDSPYAAVMLVSNGTNWFVF